MNCNSTYINHERSLSDLHGVMLVNTLALLFSFGVLLNELLECLRDTLKNRNNPIEDVRMWLIRIARQVSKLRRSKITWLAFVVR